MKAVVVDIQDKYAVVLNKGRFMKIKNNGGLRVGYEIDVPSSTVGFYRNTIIKIACAAAVFVLTVGLGYGFYTYSQPYSYVDIDINPSIELTINRYDRIIKAQGINKDGRELLEKVKYQNRSVNEGIKGIMEEAYDSGYLGTDNKNTVMLTISSEDSKRAEQMEHNIGESVSQEIDKVNSNTEVITQRVTISRHEQAKELGISPGKLGLIEKLREVQPEQKLEDLKDKPVKEILECINEIKKLLKQQEQEKKQEEQQNKRGEKQKVGTSGNSSKGNQTSKSNGNEQKASSRVQAGSGHNGREDKKSYTPTQEDEKDNRPAAGADLTAKPDEKDKHKEKHKHNDGNSNSNKSGNKNEKDETVDNGEGEQNKNKSMVNKNKHSNHDITKPDESNNQIGSGKDGKEIDESEDINDDTGEDKKPGKQERKDSSDKGKYSEEGHEYNSNNGKQTGESVQQPGSEKNNEDKRTKDNKKN